MRGRVRLVATALAMIGVSAAAQVGEPSRERLRAWHDMTADIPHIAGMPGDRVIVDRLVSAFEGMGLEVERHSFWALLCEPVAAQVQVVSAGAGAGAALGRGAAEAAMPIELPLKEVIPGDPLVDHVALTTAWNAYSGSGDVTGEVVYANYGTRADFARLRELGVDCTGKVVVCRYGGNYRGYKARYAEEAGAAALIIYTDPADAGYVRGETWPRGGFQHECGVQRGSIVTQGFHGDPLTPGVEATRDAARLGIDEADLPGIPVQPMGWVAAREILGRMEGRAREDQSWQGGLPFTYRLEGGASLLVRVRVEQVREIRESWNVIATLPGTVEPDRWVIVGCHHDAWGYGASDPTAGLICLLESARVWSEAAAAGHGPRRTIKFACWGAEEFGIIGSSEWVEGNAAELGEKAVAYINLDMAVTGPDFGAAASPSLRRVVWEAAGDVEQCNRPGVTVLQDWQQRSGGGALTTPGEGSPTVEAMPAIGSLGGGSDHVAFLCHVGVPSVALSSGGAPGTAYHTNHDHLAWYRATVGEDYAPAAMVTAVTNGVVDRLVNGEDLPLDPAATLAEAGERVAAALERAVGLGLLEAGERDALRARAERAARFAVDPADRQMMRLAAGRGDAEADGDRARERRNDAVMRAERGWIDARGMPGRAWFRNVFAATDEFSGYGAWVLPGVEAALDRRDAGLVRVEFERVIERMEGVGRVLEAR